ncbi:helix-turn-helix domain-containing protein [Priestia endophytica]|uniref:helix-turn-helix domain-containing protein n=1 Tax=Priestia endophytica TaxID=135735 RepID=UPI00203AF818|nr:helix-turn-helix transcriptional regulator [Priestia endophytica]MCM3538174.1 helix-turn-helix transcriptional regulator [Priestia endophytica]
MSEYRRSTDKLREMKGISKEEFAHHIEVSKETIDDWENNRSEPNANQLMKISKYYQISLYDLMRKDRFTSEEKEDFLSTGLYLGFTIIIIGMFLGFFFNLLILSSISNIIGALLIVFYGSLKKVAENMIQEFKLKDD